LEPIDASIQHMPLILTYCYYRLDADEENSSYSDSDDDDIRPQTSGKGGEIVSSRGTCDAMMNPDEAASSDTCSERKSEDSVDNNCTIAIEPACK
jgi:hypothetical protein